MKTCEYCGKPLTSGQKRFCSHSCQAKYFHSKGVFAKKPYRWNEEDIKILTEKYPKYGTNIPELLVKFSRNAILKKARKLGLRFVKKRLTNDTIEKAYEEWKKGKPLYKIAKEVGFSDVALFKAIARKYGESEARRLGLKARKRGAMKRRKVNFDEIDVEKLREVFEKYRASRLIIHEFCNKYRDFIREKLGFYGVHNVRRAFEKYFPEEYALVIENKMGRNYQRGRYWEYRVRDFFKNQGYYVWRSPASKGPADLIAIKKGEILLIQCKIGGSLKPKEKKELMELARSIGAKALLAQRVGRKMVLRDIFEIEDRPYRRKEK